MSEQLVLDGFEDQSLIISTDLYVNFDEKCPGRPHLGVGIDCQSNSLFESLG